MISSQRLAELGRDALDSVYSQGRRPGCPAKVLEVMNRFVALVEAELRPPPADPFTYSPPWVIAMRYAPGVSLCCDPECELSGHFAHVGECISCNCGKQHARAECPDLRKPVE